MAAPDVFSKHTLTSNLKWKGKIFQEICSGIKYNNAKMALTPRLLLKALPLKLYRREIASTATKCNPRTSMLYQNDRPGQKSVTSYVTKNGLATTLDFNYEKNSCQHPSRANQSTTTCISQQSISNNALRRVRSAGMIQNKNKYFTDNNQYLTARNLTFQQNQYFHIRQGDSTAVPGTSAAALNVYSSNGYNNCKKFEITTQIQFSYIWIDYNAVTNPNVFPVTVPSGLYDITDFNNIFQSAMLQNNHYLMNSTTNTPLFLMRFFYNSDKRCIEFDSLSTSIYQIGVYYNYPNIHAWSFVTGKTPQIILPSSPLLQQAIKFAPGTYPASLSNTTSQVFYGSSAPLLGPNYVPIYYKPNNPQFATQGAVSSSSLITRKRYNTINTSGSTFRDAFGKQTTNAVAYGVPEYGYTSKDRVGFNKINTPVIMKYSGKLNKCKILRTLRNMRNG